MRHLKNKLPKQPTIINSKLTIGFVLDDSLDSVAGVQQYVLTLGNWLQSQGHQVHYLTSLTRRTDLANLHSLSGNISIRVNGNRMRVPLPASRTRIKQVLKETDFDVLHVQLPYTPLLAGRVILAAGPKTVIIGTFHMVPKSRFILQASRLLALMDYRTLKVLDQVFSVSPAANYFSRQIFHIYSQVIPDTIKITDFHNAKPLPSLKIPGRVRILFLGSLVQRKGCILLLQAVLILRNKENCPAFDLTVCGDGPLLEDLRRFVDDNKLGGVVYFTGFVAEADKARYYASADITVLPSKGGESFGIVLLEAMASGRSAVIGGDNAGYRSIIGNCPDNCLFDPNDAAALASKLRILISDKAMRQRIASWQMQRAQAFDVEHIGPRIVDEYKIALQRRRKVP
ncbi:MAG: glycosyltransferase family 4 protein [Candidatus Saccharimonadales bacterium]